MYEKEKFDKMQWA